METLRSDDLGSGNIRAMGNVALNCDCYSEFKLFMEYKKAKIKGWQVPKGEKTLGDEVIEDLDSIFKRCSEDDEETLKWISQYFGYFYWKKASLEADRYNTKENYQPNRNNYNRGNNQRRGGR